ncbi:heme-binding protein : Heme-binding protein OS=Pedosphaera parvula (strain Ellin514) GN=Cflav_PD3187 PE=4 SV=1: Laminin_G_3: ThuA [Gemmata massiliana]|uniref:Cytochrome c domain-containing protein n=1 Tax=Gemmata massiliana TaxID=1210884 RepID=A0A6P2D555_9BACT|nr:ThuA domain-containing protein [Gemmata massiliana]VTR96193.1 heme-binding protein : Heme-binding protein OS=Pedosphaera parvula (strain Ellin514) GN=Cflav_PD3187 PE=4 SV=1: Laminin_G_3: ThuA [Gemmata massiliana]
MNRHNAPWSLPALLLGALLLVGTDRPAAAIENWADPKLPVSDGLELWLDAGRANGEKLVPHDGKLDTWYDASGKGRHLKQPKEDARPTRLPAGASAVVRFDGLDDHMRAVKQALELKEFTIFVVAAPRQNPGEFRAALAFNAAGGRDFETGLTLDQGPGATKSFNALNVEGRGFGTWQNLLKGDHPLGELRALEVTGDAKAVRLTVDNKPAGERARDGKPVSLDEITLGARYYTLGAGAQQVRGFGRWDVAEVLVYNRALPVDDAKKVRAYLDAKYANLRQSLPPDTDGAPLVVVKDPPAVQTLVPGFTARELPLDLTNINNVLYRPDGTLLALAYNGVVWRLRDTDGDGLEDKAEVFWDSKGTLRSPIGMDLTPPGYKHGDGVFVVAKTRCALIVDTDGDGKADKEIVIADGWKESFHAVDGLGVAFDTRDGSVYYGRGTYNFADPLLKDKDGKPQYKITDEAGAIVRVAPDFKTREVVATGIRFPVGLRFNKAGDLFCTDQEGATWVPDGNPFDELLHIDLKKVRHYGFPPRHPKHLPDVIDEPSTFDYGPQHQSTCGFCFNEPVKDGGPVFGPKSWAGDAIVTGESRGKLYRTQLVKTPAGYVAKNQLLACLQMLTIDCCVSPDGALVVACHSGGPGWGSGPTGKGKLYKITYTDKEHPQPVLVYPAGAREVRVEFDRPVDPQLLRDVLAQSKLTAGKFVRAGDRFEALWPGYAAVQAQKLTPRFDVKIHSAQLTPDRRTLVLATDPLRAAVHYALTLPGMGRPPAPAKGVVTQHAQIDLDFDLSGVEATWADKDGKAVWAGWLPSLDLAVARRFTEGSATHDALWAAMKVRGAAGKLTLKTQLNLTDMLRPAVQPGSTLDHEFPPETVSLAYETHAEAELTAPAATRQQSQRNGGITKGTIGFAPKRGRTAPFEVALANNANLNDFPFSLTWSTAEDARARPFQLHRALVPWADATADAGKPVELPRPKELDGGSWARGRKVFFGETAGCAKCHTVSSQGGDIGPDLTNLIHRDYPSVVRDITQPSFAINPDHVAYVVRLTDDRTVTGVVRTIEGKLHIGDKDGKTTVVDKKDVAEVRASPISVMPDDLLKKLTPEQTKDLLTFLLTPGPSMPRDYTGDEKRPKPRTRAEVNAVLAGAPNPPEKTRKVRVVLVAGAKDHGPGEHDYPAWLKAWGELLAAADNIEVVTATDWPAKDEFQKADAMVFYQYGDWDAKRAADIDAFLERGGGLTYIHWAVAGRKDSDEFAKRIGLAAKLIKFRHGALDLDFSSAKHPVTRNLGKLKLVDESYWKMTGELPKGRVLGWGKEDNEPQPLFWSLERGKGRVFVSIPGHFSWSFDDPLFRALLLRGIAWTAKEPVDRFNDLVWPGADIAK